MAGEGEEPFLAVHFDLVSGSFAGSLPPRSGKLAPAQGFDAGSRRGDFRIAVQLMQPAMQLEGHCPCRPITELVEVDAGESVAQKDADAIVIAAPIAVPNFLEAAPSRGIGGA